MLTPEIKTNLILKEIGIKRYSLRSNQANSSKKETYYYQKGLILAFLDKPFENFVKEQQDLIKAILESTKLDKGTEKSDTVNFQSKKELKENICSFNDMKLVIIFGDIIDSKFFDSDTIKAPSINKLIIEKDLKKDLWLEIKSKLEV